MFSPRITYWGVITVVFGVAFVYIASLQYQLKNSQDELKSLHVELEKAKAVQESRVEFVDRVVEKEVVRYQTQIKTIKEIVKDENKSECDNAFDVLFTAF